MMTPTRPGGLLAWLRGTGSPPAPARLVTECRDGGPMAVPADGGAFEFTVYPEFTWSARGLSPARLGRFADAHTGGAIRALHNTIWPVGRRYAPHHPDAAECAMNEALRQPWFYAGGGRAVSCRASVQVVADSRVTDWQRPHWEWLAELDVRHRAERQRLAYVEDMLARWRGLIESLGESPVVIHAAELVDAGVHGVLDRFERGAGDGTESRPTTSVLR